MSLLFNMLSRLFRASLVAQGLKHLPARRETRVQSLGWEDPLEKEMAMYSSILAWKIPWTEDASGLQSIELQRVGHTHKANIRMYFYVKQRHYFADKGPSSQSCGFSSSHVWMWELEKKESWALKNWCFWTMVLEKTLESPSDCKEIQPVHPKGDQSWVFIGRTDVEVETPILWPPHAKSWLIGKDPDAGKDWGQKKWVTEDEVIR